MKKEFSLEEKLEAISLVFQKYVRDLVPDMSRYKTRLRAGGRNNVAARSQ